MYFHGFQEKCLCVTSIFCRGFTSRRVLKCWRWTSLCGKDETVITFRIHRSDSQIAFQYLTKDSVYYSNTYKTHIWRRVSKKSIISACPLILKPSASRKLQSVCFLVYCVAEVCDVLIFCDIKINDSNNWNHNIALLSNAVKICHIFHAPLQYLKNFVRSSAQLRHHQTNWRTILSLGNTYRTLSYSIQGGYIRQYAVYTIRIQPVRVCSRMECDKTR